MMKKIVNLSLAFVLMMGTMVWAQSERGRRGGDPTERAERLTTSMTELLSLSEEQQNQVGDLNLEYAMKMHETRKEAQGDRASMRNAMKELNQEKEEKLTAVLSEEQMQMYQDKKDEFMQKAKERRGKRKDREKQDSSTQ